jgi:hypothetical protein
MPRSGALVFLLLVAVLVAAVLIALSEGVLMLGVSAPA